jgi:lipoate-protein ligase B
VIAWRWLGTLEHADAVALQHQHRDAVIAGQAGAATIFLCEHPPVITLGQRADPRHVVIDQATAAQRGIAIARASRGGDVTYHGPGQLMIYPVVRVRRVVDFLRQVGEQLATLAAECGVVGAEFRRDPAGLWLGDAKLAACGLHLARGVAIHGWAWNVSTPAAAWDVIVPCGLSVQNLSLADACQQRGLPPPPSLAALAARLGPRLAHALA